MRNQRAYVQPREAGRGTGSGLRHGAGKNYRPGDLCVEQAIALCAGADIDETGHAPTDQPSCIDPTVRTFGIGLNDRAWSTPGARAKGLWGFAFAQLGTGEDPDFDSFAWLKRTHALMTERLAAMPGVRHAQLTAAGDALARGYPRDAIVHMMRAIDVDDDDDDEMFSVTADCARQALCEQRKKGEGTP